MVVVLELPAVNVPVVAWFPAPDVLPVKSSNAYVIPVNYDCAVHVGSPVPPDVNTSPLLPVPAEMVLGVTPAPPPTTNALLANNADDAIVVVLEKYGIPPDVPDDMPVPPLATDKSVPDQSELLIANVPPRVIVPVLVISPPVNVIPLTLPLV